MDLKITTTNEGKNYVITLEGQVDYNNANEFDVVMKKILPDADSIVVDMEKLEYISSAGIRVIVYALNELEEKGGVKLRKLNSIVKDIFEITGLGELIE